MRYLNESRLSLPHIICISHLHDDHVAGFASIFRHLIQRDNYVDRVYTNYAGHTSRKRSKEGGHAVVQQLRDLLDDQQHRLRDFCSDEAPFELDGVTLNVLHPDKFDLNEHQDRDDMLNNLSGVLRVDYGESSVLLPGDIEGWGASRLLLRHGSGALRASLILFPHHGAEWEHLTPTGAVAVQHGQQIFSTNAFIEAVAPTWTVLSVGTDNDGHWAQYRHPRQSVLESLREWHDAKGAGFVCTEVTPRCDADVCSRMPTTSDDRPVGVPCGGTIRFRLDTSGGIMMDRAIQADWQHVVDELPQPQCRFAQPR